MKLAIVIPAYNEEQVISEVLEAVPERIRGVSRIEKIVVDDCSDDETGTCARRAGAKVLRHLINRGLGGALSTGLEFAKRNDFDITVTLDADGQHDPSEIPKLIQPILSDQSDFVVGSRLLEKGEMPLVRTLANRIGNVVTFLLYGVWTTDSQSGFRAFSRKAIKSIELKSQRMEVSSEFFKEVKAKDLRYSEVPIKSIYTTYSLSKGQKTSNALNIYFKLLVQFFR